MSLSKSWEKNRNPNGRAAPQHMCFIDLQKADGPVDRTVLREVPAGFVVRLQ